MRTTSTRGSATQAQASERGAARGRPLRGLRKQPSGPERGPCPNSPQREGGGGSLHRKAKKNSPGENGLGKAWEGAEGGTRGTGRSFPSRKRLAQVPLQAKKRKGKSQFYFKRPLLRHLLLSSKWRCGWTAGFRILKEINNSFPVILLRAAQGET